MGKKIVIALGGNALGNNLPEQMIAVKQTAKAIADLIEGGNGVNIVPEAAEAIMEFRALPSMAPEQTIAAVLPERASSSASAQRFASCVMVVS